jgi:hypothetical protein
LPEEGADPELTFRAAPASAEWAAAAMARGELQQAISRKTEFREREEEPAGRRGPGQGISQPWVDPELLLFVTRWFRYEQAAGWNAGSKAFGLLGSMENNGRF